MAILLKVMDIHKKYMDRDILKGLSFHIEEQEVLALVGVNGSGKTTTANIIAGLIDYEKGQLLWQRGDQSIGFLHQATYYSEKDFKDAIYAEGQDSRRFLEYAKKLGLKSVWDWTDEQLNNLSGGEKTKLLLAKILSEKPNLLILDEPTNHMDYKGIRWLVKTLNGYRGTVLLISHDRYFMDQCANRVVEIDEGCAKTYDGNYTYFRNLKKKLYEEQVHAFKEQEKYKAKINSDIRQLKEWSEKGHRESTKKLDGSGVKMGLKEKYRKRAKKKDKQVKSRIKRLEKIEVEGIEKPKEEQVIYFKFNGEKKGGDILLEAMDVKKSFGDKVIFEKSDFYIKRGEKVALFGPNGCGKSTLIKCIMGDFELDAGRIHMNKATNVAYLSQDVLDMKGDETVIGSFKFESNAQRGYIGIVLDNLGFHGDLLEKQVKNLSLGERTRLKLAHMMIEENSLLILDEPTNHLDLHSREMLEETIINYGGTVIAVSHDRYFLERSCNMTIIFANGQIKRLEMSFGDYLMREEAISRRSKKEKSDKRRNIEEQLMVYDAKMASILNDFNAYAPGSEPYEALEEVYQQLIREKKGLEASIRS